MSPDDLYGQKMTVSFVARLRDEQRFDGLDALVAQIKRDISVARRRVKRGVGDSQLLSPGG